MATAGHATLMATKNRTAGTMVASTMFGKPRRATARSTRRCDRAVARACRESPRLAATNLHECAGPGRSLMTGHPETERSLPRTRLLDSRAERQRRSPHVPHDEASVRGSRRACADHQTSLRDVVDARHVREIDDDPANALGQSVCDPGPKVRHGLGVELTDRTDHVCRALRPMPLQRARDRHRSPVSASGDTTDPTDGTGGGAEWQLRGG